MGKSDIYVQIRHDFNHRLRTEIALEGWDLNFFLNCQRISWYIIWVSSRYPRLRLDNRFDMRQNRWQTADMFALVAVTVDIRQIITSSIISQVYLTMDRQYKAWHLSWCMTFWPAADTWWQLTSNKSQCLLDNRHMAWHGICMTFWPAGDIHTCGLTDPPLSLVSHVREWESWELWSHSHTLSGRLLQKWNFTFYQKKRNVAIVALQLFYHCSGSAMTSNKLHCR